MLETMKTNPSTITVNQKGWWRWQAKYRGFANER